MKAEATPLPGTEDTLITGVREAASQGAPASGPVDPSETMSGRRHYPPETWDPDEQPESELPIPQGELLGGKYTVERMFAEGGMGIVCLGRHVQLDQVVAIKFLRRALSGRPSIVQRFLNEARALAALRSEHVVRVIDVGQLESGRPYLVMEHLEGVHLDALLERDGAVAVDTALRYVMQVCEALAEAHALGIVHRDIKPENLFLWSGGPTIDTVKVLDFGLAKQLGSSKALGVTGPQDSLGSPCYMSPEQITTPQLVDSRTDVWSLGVVLYRLLTNALPFSGASLVEVLSHILNAPPKPLPEVSKGLDAELNAIVCRCLERSPEARYQTMSELADALNAYLVERQQLQPNEQRWPSSKVSSESSAKIRIPGVHSRWPAGLAVLAVLLVGVVYGADRSGQVRLRNLTDGWLTPARLAVEVPWPSAPRDVAQPQPLFRGVFGLGTASEGTSARALHAVPEREIATGGPLAQDNAIVPLSDAERELKQAAYREYLKNQGLTPLSDVPQADDQAEPSDQPYGP